MNEIERIQLQRKQYRQALKDTSGWFRRIIWRNRRKQWQANYDELGLRWGMLREGPGLNLTGATLLNDDGQIIDSEEFKQIAAEKILGKSGPEYFLKAEYHTWNVIVTRPDGTQTVVKNKSGPGNEVEPDDEVYQGEYVDYPFESPKGTE